MDKFNNISTERLILRSLMAQDAEPMFRYSTQPSVSKFQDKQFASLKDTEAFIENNSNLKFSQKGWYQIGIAIKESNQLIGDCGIHFLENSRIAEFGITLAIEHQSKGFATETLTAVFNLLFVSLNKHRVFASVDPENIKSMALMERLGMRKEAHFVQSLWFKNRWADDVIFAMLSKEWKNIPYCN